MQEVRFVLFLFNVLSLVFLTLYVVRVLSQIGMHGILKGQFWFLVFYLAYVSFPAILVNYAFDSGIRLSLEFSESALVISEAIAAITNFVVVILTGFFPIRKGLDPEFEIENRMPIAYIVAWVIIFVFFFLSCLALYEVLGVFNEKGYLLAFYDLNARGDELEERFHFFSLRYLVIPCFFYLFLNKKKKVLLLLFLPNIVFEILSGKRTSAFIYILFIYMLFVAQDRKTYVLQISFGLMMLLFSVLFSRLASQLQFSGAELSFDSLVFGATSEFVNTFLTLPFIVDSGLIGSRNPKELIFDYLSGLLPGFVQVFVMQYFDISEWGDSVAKFIGKGYGFGCNILTFFIGTLGYIGLLGVPIVYLVSIYFDRKFRSFSNFVLTFLLIVQYRLFMRQGFASFAVFYYLSAVYVGFFLLFRKSEFRRFRFNLAVHKSKVV